MLCMLQDKRTYLTKILKILKIVFMFLMKFFSVIHTHLNPPYLRLRRPKKTQTFLSEFLTLSRCHGLMCPINSLFERQFAFAMYRQSKRLIVLITRKVMSALKTTQHAMTCVTNKILNFFRKLGQCFFV